MFERTIPLEKAAAFFVGLKSWCQPSREEDELMAACVKEAADKAPMKTPLAEEAPADSAQVDPHPFLNVKSAALRFRLLAETIKTAGDEGPAAMEDSSNVLSSPTPAKVPPEAEYLANEQQGMEAENAAAVEYYQAQLERARAETAAAQETTQELQSQLEQLSMQQQDHDMQLSSAQQEGQIAQQAATQQVQQATQQATQAMQMAVDAENRALQAKGQEAAAKIEVQGVRSQLFDMAAQGLPGTQPELGGEGGAAQGLEPLDPTATDPAAAGAAPGAEGAPEGGEVAPEGGEGAQEAPADGTGAPDSGMNQAGESASADGMPGQEGPTESAAEAQPGTAQPSGDTSGGAGGGGSGPQAASEGGGSSSDAKRQGQISIKVGSAAVRARIEAAVPGIFKTAGLSPAAVGTLAGGALGAGAAALEAGGGGPDLGALRETVNQRESAPKRPGVGGFIDALALVKDKAKLGLGEATQAHPIPATIAGGLIGGGMGRAAAPRISELLREAAQHHGV